MDREAVLKKIRALRALTVDRGATAAEAATAKAAAARLQSKYGLQEWEVSDAPLPGPDPYFRAPQRRQAAPRPTFADALFNVPVNSTGTAYGFGPSPTSNIWFVDEQGNRHTVYPGGTVRIEWD